MVMGGYEWFYEWLRVVTGGYGWLGGGNRWLQMVLNDYGWLRVLKL